MPHCVPHPLVCGPTVSAADVDPSDEETVVLASVGDAVVDAASPPDEATDVVDAPLEEVALEPPSSPHASENEATSTSAEMRRWVIEVTATSEASDSTAPQGRDDAPSQPRDARVLAQV